jgi:hypothetical protein
MLPFFAAKRVLFVDAPSVQVSRRSKRNMDKKLSLNLMQGASPFELGLVYEYADPEVAEFAYQGLLDCSHNDKHRYCLHTRTSSWSYTPYSLFITILYCSCGKEFFLLGGIHEKSL